MSLQSCWRTVELDWAVLVITTLDYHNPRREGSPTFNSYGTLVYHRIEAFITKYNLGKHQTLGMSPEEKYFGQCQEKPWDPQLSATPPSIQALTL